MSKVGFGGDDAPRAVFPTIVGEVTLEKQMMAGRSGVSSYRSYCTVGDRYVGDEALAKRGILKIRNLVERGEMALYRTRDVKSLYIHSFYNELSITPDEHPLMVVEPCFHSLKSRQEMTALFFETYNVPGLYFAVAELCGVIAAGLLTGIGLGSGDGVSSVVPVYEGHAILAQMKSIRLAGTDITSYLVKILAERGWEFETTAEREIVRDIKEKLCFVSRNYKDEVDSSNEYRIEREYELPDGSKMTIGSERLRAPEILFKPSCIGCEFRGIHWQLQQCISELDMDLWKVFYRNVVLSGGSTLFDGFQERLTSELTYLAPPTAKIHIAALRERKFTPWIGASILTSLSTFHRRWITVREYNDVGASIVLRKCF